MRLFLFHFQHYTRQQTTAVDYKRLINGLVLTRVASLQRKHKPLLYEKKATQQCNAIVY